MADFSVYPGNIKSLSSKEVSISRKMVQYANQIESIQSKLSLESDAGREVQKALRKIAEGVKKDSDTLKNMGDVLEKIANLYDRTDSQLANVQVQKTAYEWANTNKSQLSEFNRRIEDYAKKFIKKWGEIFDISSDNSGEILFRTVLELTTTPILVGPKFLKWLIYEGSRDGWYDDFFDAMDFQRDDDGIYHVNVNRYDNDMLNLLVNDRNGSCWQQAGGYNDLYDYVFDTFCDMEANKDISFVTKDGTKYTLWMWKGEYLNLGAGGELGVYTGYGPHLNCATNSELKMSLHVDYGDGTSSDWKDETWWITSFNPYKQNYKAEDLTLTYTLDFSDANPDLWNAFYEKYHNDPQFGLDAKHKTVTITF